MPPIFLTYHHPAGEKIYAPLVTANEPIFFLPAGVEEEIDFTTERPPGRNDVAQIELVSSLPFLSAFGKEICQLIQDGVEIPIPTSVDGVIRSVLLRDGDQFETSAGRWSVERDDEQGTIQTIHNSMRPPPLPQLPVVNDLELLGVPKDKDHAPNHSTRPPPAELDDSLVEDVPYSADPLLEIRKEARLSTVSHDEATEEAARTPSTTQESTREVLNDAIDGMVDSSCDRTASTDESTKDVDRKPVGPAQNVALETETVTHEAVEAVLEDPAHNRKKRKAIHAERTYKRKKTFTQRMMGQQQDEETIVVAPASPALGSSPSLSTEKSPSPSKKEKKSRGRPAKETAPMSTPELRPTLDDQNPSPVPDSARSTRSHRSQSVAETFYTSERSPVMYFASNTTIDENHKTMKTFYDLGGKKSKSIGGADMLCVVDGQLKKSEAFLVAIAEGADIVTEDWVVEAHRIKKFPDRSKFMPNAKAHEQAWGFRLNDAIERGKKGLTDLLSSTTVLVTAQFKTDMGNTCYQGIKNVATALGAEAVKSVPKNGRKVQKAIAIGVAEDLEACEVGRLGMKLYDKELLTSAVLKGHLDLDSNEYSIDIPVKEEDKD